VARRRWEELGSPWLRDALVELAWCARAAGELPRAGRLARQPRPEERRLRLCKVHRRLEAEEAAGRAEVVRGVLAEAGREEIEFYRAKGVLEGLRKINGISS
jgi:hypothetical protein